MAEFVRLEAGLALASRRLVMKQPLGSSNLEVGILLFMLAPCVLGHCNPHITVAFRGTVTRHRRIVACGGTGCDKVPERAAVGRVTLRQPAQKLAEISAIDLQDVAGDVPGQRRAEKEHRGSHFVGPTEAA